MALQDTWRGRIDQNNDLLSLGSSKAISFPGDGEDGRVLWKSGEFLSEKSNVRDSSAVISPVDAVADRKVTSESSEQSGSTLKEHDYIGMAEVNSASSETLKILCKNETSEELNLKETDLCLGLGLALTPSKVADTTTDTGKSVAFTYCQLNDEPKPILDTHLSTEYVFSEGFSPELRSLQARRCNSTSRTTTGDTTNVVKLSSHHENIDFQLPQLIAPLMPEVGSASRMGNVFQGSRVFVHPSILKNGLKRGFSEVASDVATFSLPPEARAMNAMAVSSGDADVKSLSKQSQKAFLSSWSPTKPLVTTSWQAGLEQSAALPYGVNQAVTISRVERSVADATAPPFNGNRRMDDGMQEPPTNEVPTRKDRVVGWPPIRSYRKVTLAKPTEMFVKVNMDGITVGRKVDINAHSSYEGLLSALEDMFQPSNNAPESSCNDSKHFRLFNGSDYVLTYEDKDGDWMLVGDVPWSMFTTTVRRLRITRGLEATGPGPRGKEKVT